MTKASAMEKTVANFVKKNGTLIMMSMLFFSNYVSKELKLNMTQRLMLQGFFFCVILFLQYRFQSIDDSSEGEEAPDLADHDLTLIQGELPNGKKPYVLEFWATWCGPCVKAIPHVSTLHKKYGKKVDFIGVSSEDESTVKSFLKKKGSESETGSTGSSTTNSNKKKKKKGKSNILGGTFFTYGCAISSSLANSCGVTGLPHARVIDEDGIVFWAGHPMSEDFDAAIAAVAEGETVESRRINSNSEEESKKED